MHISDGVLSAPVWIGGYAAAVGIITASIKKIKVDNIPGTISIFSFGFLMGIAPCVSYVAILTYIACVAENPVLIGILYAALFAAGTALAPIVLGSLMGIIPEKLFKSAKLLKTFQVVYGVVLVFFGFQLIYYVLNLVI